MAAEWYYTTDKRQMGPVSWRELRELADVGILKPHDLVWSDGMDEWAKAINQSGLFADGKEVAAVGGKKQSAYADTKPPPGRRTRRADEQEDDDDDKKAKTRKRKREEERAKMGVGIKVGLILAGGLFLLVLLVGCVGGIVWVSWPAGPQQPGGVVNKGGDGGAVANKGDGGGAKKGDGGLVNKGGGDGGAKGGGGPRVQNYVINNLIANAVGGDVRSFNFQQGKRVVITVTNTLPNPNTDVDLYVYRGNEKNPLARDELLPPQSRNCRVDFVPTTTGIYDVRVVNLGPGVATSCAVRIEEQ